jgi:hypothetical protein
MEPLLSALSLRLVKCSWPVAVQNQVLDYQCCGTGGPVGAGRHALPLQTAMGTNYLGAIK